jgi:hypothetical protein
MVAFDFHFDHSSYTYNLRRESDDDVVRFVDTELAHSVGALREKNTGTFNDMPFYLGLRRRYDCVALEKVVVKRNNYILGIRATYRCTTYATTPERGEDTVVFKEAPMHASEAGPFANADGGRPTTQFLTLKPGEFLLGVATRQGAILDAIRFFTNRRKVYVGGYGGWDEGPGEQMRLPEGSAGRVVAFAGTFRGVVHRLGYCCNTDVRYRSEVLLRRNLLLLRNLCQQERAFPLQLTETAGVEDSVIQALMTEIPDDLVSEILGYL